VILFEDHAHLPYGHYGLLYRQFAEALALEGYEVHVITRRGPAGDNAGLGIAGAASISCLARRHRALAAFGYRAGVVTGGRFGNGIRQTALVAAVRRRARRLPDGERTAALIMSSVDIAWAAALAPARARWLLYAFTPAAKPHKPGSPVLNRIAAIRDRRRRRAGGRVELGVQHAGEAANWRARHPWLDPLVLPNTGSDPSTPTSRVEARRLLGLPADGNIGLVLGHAQGSKDVTAAFTAFSGAAHPGAGRLVAAGTRMAERFDALRDARPELRFDAVTLFDGYVGFEERHLLYSAANYAVISFVNGWPFSSGTLADAVSYGLPVCCSEPGEAARLVTEYGLGVLFPAGDADALVAAAADAASFTVDPAGRQRFFTDFGTAEVVRALMAAIVGVPAA
jgi:glycosyltransferase involved in cell wall biosynthesis